LNPPNAGDSTWGRNLKRGSHLRAYYRTTEVDHSGQILLLDPLETTFAALLEQIGPENDTPDGACTWISWVTVSVRFSIPAAADIIVPPYSKSCPLSWF
jgi:hypothetical protein